MYTKSGVCHVNLYDFGGAGEQYGKAGGYGYDKFVAALAGMVFQGITLVDHCALDQPAKKIKEAYESGQISEEQAAIQAKAIGAKWNGGIYVPSGLDRLKDLGYDVIQAI